MNSSNKTKEPITILYKISKAFLIVAVLSLIPTIYTLIIFITSGCNGFYRISYLWLLDDSSSYGWLLSVSAIVIAFIVGVSSFSLSQDHTKRF